MTSRLTWAGPNAQASCLKREMGHNKVVEMSPLLNLSDSILNNKDSTTLSNRMLRTINRKSETFSQQPTMLRTLLLVPHPEEVSQNQGTEREKEREKRRERKRERDWTSQGQMTWDQRNLRVSNTELKKPAIFSSIKKSVIFNKKETCNILLKRPVTFNSIKEPVIWYWMKKIAFSSLLVPIFQPDTTVLTI